MSGRLFRLFLSGIFLCLCISVTQEQTAFSASQAPAARAGAKIDAGDFNLTLPQGWIMPYPLNHKQDGISGVFSHEKTEVTVTVNVIHIKMKAREFMERILPEMKRSKLQVSTPVSRNGFLVVDLKSSQVHGQAWFGSNGKSCVAVVILTPKGEMTSANQLLAALKGKVPLPRKID